MVELSPEEKQRIYLEEKERLEVQDKLKKEKQQKDFQKGCIGCFVFIAIIFLVLFIAIAIGGSSGSSKKRSQSTYDDVLDEYHSKGEFLGYQRGEGEKLYRDLKASREATEMIQKGNYR